MKRVSKHIVMIALLLAGMSCTTAFGQKISSAEKIRIIDETIETKLKEAKGGDALDAVLESVGAKFALDTDGDTPESAAFIQELEKRAKEKYPATDKELLEKFTPAAEKTYPLYKAGDKVTVIYRLGGVPRKVTGPYYRQDARFVWIGPKKIRKSDLAKEFSFALDADRVNRARTDFIQNHLNQYHRKRKAYLDELKRENDARIHELRGEVRHNNEWLTPRKAVMAKYTEAVASQDWLIADNVRRAKKCPDYKDKMELLESTIQRYPNHKSISELKALRVEFKENHINGEIARAVQRAREAQDLDEQLRILDAVIRKYPNHASAEELKTLKINLREKHISSEYMIAIDKADEARSLDEKIRILDAFLRKYPGQRDEEIKDLKNKFRQAHIEKEIANAVQRARRAQNLNEKLRILDDIIRKYPDHKSVADLKAMKDEFRENHARDQVNEAIQKAQDSYDYKQKYAVLESVIQKYPEYKATAMAKSRLREYRIAYSKKTREVREIIACCSRWHIRAAIFLSKYDIEIKALNASVDRTVAALSRDYQINLMNRGFLSVVQDRFRGIPDSNRLATVLSALQNKVARQKSFGLSDKIVEREILMLRALKLSEKREAMDEASPNQLKEKSAKTNNPDMLLPIAMLELSEKQTEGVETLRKGISQGNGGCLFFVFNILDKSFGGAPAKAVEVNFWPAIIKMGTNAKIISMLKEKKLSPEESKLVALSDRILENGTRKLTIRGNMGAARGSFLVFEDRLYYFSINNEMPSDVTVDEKKWSNLALPFILDEKIYPCIRHSVLGGNKSENVKIIINWNDSIAIYPNLNGRFSASLDVIKNNKAQR